MLGPALGTVCLLAGLYHLGRLAARRAPAASAGAHAVMGLGMAAMFVPALDPVPQPVWVALFVLSGAWFAATAWRAGTVAGEAGHHVVGAVAMLFMLLGGHDHDAAAGAVDPEHAHHAAGAGAPALLVTVLALLFAGWFVADVVRTLVVRTDGAPARRFGGSATQVRTPVTVSAAAHLAMSVAMAVMLLGMA